MANTYQIRKAESVPIGIEIPLDSGPEIVEVKARRVKAKDAGAYEQQAYELDERHAKRKINSVDWLIEKIKLNVVFSAETEAKLRELDVSELTEFGKLCARIAAGEHEEEKKP